MADRSKKFKSVEEYIETTGLKKGFVANRWGLSRFRMTALLHRDRYPISLSDEEVAKIAADLQWTPDQVRKLYPREAA
jgi:hypothetical protein